MSRTSVLGIDCALYYLPYADRTALTQTTDLTSIVEDYWKLVEPIKDVTLNLSATLWDATNRGSNRWRQQVQTIKESGLEFQILWLPDNAVFSEMLARFLDGCPMAFMALDAQWDFPNAAPVLGRCGEDTFLVSGLMADFTVSNFSRGEPLEEGAVADVSLTPTIGDIYPTWISGTGTASTTAAP